MLGIKLQPKYESKAFVEALRERGLLTVYAADNVFRIVPPLIMTKAQGLEGIEIIESYLKTL